MNQTPAGRPFTAPTVDQLSVRVIVDSRYERFLPKMTHPFMTIENIDTIPGRQMTSLACEWGPRWTFWKIRGEDAGDGGVRRREAARRAGRISSRHRATRL